MMTNSCEMVKTARFYDLWGLTVGEEGTPLSPWEMERRLGERRQELRGWHFGHDVSIVNQPSLA
jgi:hypothetical protein